MISGLQKILVKHNLWINKEEGGQKADLSGANLIIANLSGARLNEANLSEANLRGADLSEANLSEVNLKRANLSEANLKGADLSEANLSGVNLKGAKLSGANLRGADLSEADLSEVNLKGADLSEVILNKANLSGTNLIEANLTEAKLHQANLRGTYLIGADLSKADLSEADLIGAKLYQTKLHQTDLSRAKLYNINLSKAKLREAKLSRAVLRGADLRETDLREANLSKTNLKGAKLIEADLSGANLNGADLTGAFLERTSFHRVKCTIIGDWSKATFDGTIMDNYLYQKLPPEIKKKRDQITIVGMDNPDAIKQTIDFSKEYYASGMKILNGFTEVLRDKYSEKEVSVSIQKEGLRVTMTIDPPEGEKEVIEKYLDEYAVMVRENGDVSKLINDPLNAKLLEMELQNAKQINKIMEMEHGKTVEVMDGRISNLESMVARLLPANPRGDDLTQKEFKCLAALQEEGSTNESIASEMGVTTQTVEIHLRNVRRKLGKTRDELKTMNLSAVNVQS